MAKLTRTVEFPSLLLALEKRRVLILLQRSYEEYCISTGGILLNLRREFKSNPFMIGGKKPRLQA